MTRVFPGAREAGRLAKGRLTSITGPSYATTPSYDNVGRELSQTTTINGTSYTVATAYDSLGRPDTLTYPTGFKTKKIYDPQSRLIEVRNGTSNALARGMAPAAVGFYTNFNSVVGSRNTVIGTVVNTHQCMFTTASWGDAQVTTYTSVSADADDIIFDHRIPWTQSQSNLGNQKSRPQAWAKNIFSIGGVQHFDNSNPADDSWAAGGASTGPAADGRIKPGLCAPRIGHSNIG